MSTWSCLDAGIACQCAGKKLLNLSTWLKRWLLLPCKARQALSSMFALVGFKTVKLDNTMKYITT